MKVLVAGGTGAIGHHAVPLLVDAGHDVTVVSRSRQSYQRMEGLGAHPIALDVFDVDAVTAAAAGADAVVNLMTRIPATPAALRMAAWRDNDRLRRDASRVLATAAARAGARFVQESFAPTYPDCGDAWIDEAVPLDPVAQTSTVVDAEASAAAVTEAGGVGAVLRFGLFYGAASVQSREMLGYAKLGVLVLPGPATRYTSMVHLHDAASAVVAALAVPAGVYNVVEDEPSTIGDQAAVLAELVGRRRVRPLPAAAGRLKVLRALSRSHRISNAKLKSASGWRPRHPNVREGWSQVAAELHG